MRFLIQSVEHAAVSVDDQVIGSIGKGLLVFVGISETDTREIADKMVSKLVRLRIFKDEAGKTNLAAADVGAEFLVISQFTLYADCRKGNRPSFTQAGKADLANALYEYVADSVWAQGFRTEMGSFGAHMKVDLLNDGPFTIFLDSDEVVR